MGNKPIGPIKPLMLPPPAPVVRNIPIAQPGLKQLPPPGPMNPYPSVPTSPEVVASVGRTSGPGALNPKANIPLLPGVGGTFPRLKVEIRVPMRDATGRFVKSKLKPKKEEE
jgi:hypothetical protein